MKMSRVRLPGGPVVVPEAVLAGLEAVRQTGRTNMLDRDAVRLLAAALGHPAAAAWMRAHPDLYGRGVFCGFVAAEARAAARASGADGGRSHGADSHLES